MQSVADRTERDPTRRAEEKHRQTGQGLHKRQNHRRKSRRFLRVVLGQRDEPLRLESGRWPVFYCIMVGNMTNVKTRILITALMAAAIIGYFGLPSEAACGQNQTSRSSATEAEAAALNIKGLNYTKAGRYADALKAFSEAVGLQPNFAYAHYNLGVVYLVLRRYPDAARSFTVAIQYCQNYDAAYRYLGSTLITMGDNSAAIKPLLKAVEINPKFSGAYNDLGAAYFNLAYYSKAVEALRQAVALEPKSAEIQFNLGNALTIMKRYEEAALGYQEASRLRPA